MVKVRKKPLNLWRLINGLPIWEPVMLIKRFEGSSKPEPAFFNERKDGGDLSRSLPAIE